MTERADLLDLHLAALFTQDEQGNLIATNDPEPDQVAAPRLYLGRSRTRAVLRFRRGMDESTRAALRDLAAPDLTPNDPNREPVNRAEMAKLLAAEQPIQNIHFGPAFSFPDLPTIGSTWSRHSDVRLPLPGEKAGACPIPRIEYGAGIDTGVRGPQRHSDVRLPLPGERAGVRGRPRRHSGESRNPVCRGIRSPLP